MRAPTSAIAFSPLFMMSLLGLSLRLFGNHKKKDIHRVRQNTKFAKSVFDWQMSFCVRF
jgi:hypothetical protein